MMEEAMCIASGLFLPLFGVGQGTTAWVNSDGVSVAYRTPPTFFSCDEEDEPATEFVTGTTKTASLPAYTLLKLRATCRSMERMIASEIQQAFKQAKKVDGGAEYVTCYPLITNRMALLDFALCVTLSIWSSKEAEGQYVRISSMHNERIVISNLPQAVMFHSDKTNQKSCEEQLRNAVQYMQRLKGIVIWRQTITVWDPEHSLSIPKVWTYRKVNFWECLGWKSTSYWIAALLDKFHEIDAEHISIHWKECSWLLVYNEWYFHRGCNNRSLIDFDFFYSDCERRKLDCKRGKPDWKRRKPAILIEMDGCEFRLFGKSKLSAFRKWGLNPEDYHVRLLRCPGVWHKQLLLHTENGGDNWVTYCVVDPFSSIYHCLEPSWSPTEMPRLAEITETVKGNLLKRAELNPAWGRNLRNSLRLSSAAAIYYAPTELFVNLNLLRMSDFAKKLENALIKANLNITVPPSEAVSIEKRKICWEELQLLDAIWKYRDHYRYVAERCGPPEGYEIEVSVIEATKQAIEVFFAPFEVMLQRMPQLYPAKHTPQKQLALLQIITTLHLDSNYMQNLISCVRSNWASVLKLLLTGDAPEGHFRGIMSHE